MPTDPAYIMRDICLDIEKEGSIKVYCYHVDNENDPVKPLTGTSVSLSVRYDSGSFDRYENTDDRGYSEVYPDYEAVFENIPIGSEFTVTGRKGGCTGFNGRNTYSGPLMSRQHTVKLEFSNIGALRSRRKPGPVILFPERQSRWLAEECRRSPHRRTLR
ncbi:MAG: hypothetical protein AB1374_13915, partial [Bacillota bacterium]